MPGLALVPTETALDCARVAVLTLELRREQSGIGLAIRERVDPATNGSSDFDFLSDRPTALDEPPANVGAGPCMNDVMLDRGADAERLVNHRAQANPERVRNVADPVQPHRRRHTGEYPADA